MSWSFQKRPIHHLLHARYLCHSIVFAIVQAVWFSKKLMPTHRALRGVLLAESRPTSLHPCPCVGTVNSSVQIRQKKKANMGKFKCYITWTMQEDSEAKKPLLEMQSMIQSTTVTYCILSIWLSHSPFLLLDSLSLYSLTHSISQYKCRNLITSWCKYKKDLRIKNKNPLGQGVGISKPPSGWPAPASTCRPVKSRLCLHRYTTGWCTDWVEFWVRWSTE